MQVFNTLGRELQEFKPSEPGKVTFYQCGPTVYWRQHIGNMRAMVMADLVHRTLKYNNLEVNYVRNYTDVGHLTSDDDHGEDKMAKAAKRDKKSPEEIADFYIKQFDTDVKALNVLQATQSPKATDHIQEMIDMVSDLMEKGFAYQTDLAIYFDVSKYPDYTKLSRQDLDMLCSGRGHGTVSDPEKKAVADFSLWFFKAGSHKNAIQTWSNPFSELEGFPGWHIECSAFIKKYLGNTIDIHMGGIEHIPVHHTNEIAQSCCAHDAPLAHYWLHNEHLAVDGNKMSKSEGTSFTISDIQERGFSSMDLRYFFLQAHYRSKQNFTWQSLEASSVALQRMRNKLQGMPSGGTVLESWKDKFTAAINHDFGIPEGLAIAHELLKSDINPADIKATILDFDSLFGLNLEAWLPSNNIEISKEVQELLEKRKNARQSKDWALADNLRNQIADAGYEIKDGPEGQETYKK